MLSGISGLSVNECIRKIQQIEIKTKKLSTGPYAGKHLSIFSGRGIDFTDIREYVPGDDVRSIDWKTTARFQTPYLRLFSEDRDQTFYLLIDRSGSQIFGREKSKDEKMLEISASIIFSSEAHRDATGLCMFTETVEKFIPAGKGRNHSVNLLNAIIKHNPEYPGTDIAQALRYMYNTLKRRSVIIVISDFEGDNFEKELSILSKKHEVYSLTISDMREEILPDIGLIRLQDSETGEIVIADTSDPVFCRNYSEIVLKENQEKEKILRRCNVKTLFIKTEEECESKSRYFFSGKGEVC